MSILSIAITIFLVLETLNILTLYFQPGTKIGNGLGVFNAFEESKKYPEIHALVRYLINWVAGTKLIFVCLLIVILITGDRQTRMLSTIALIVSILSFFWRLYPAMRKLDKDGGITPKGYSRTLAYMIAAFLLMFTVALTLYLTGLVA